MRPTFLKVSSLEPNFSFGSVGSAVPANTSADSPGGTTNSHPNNSGFVLHKVTPNLLNFKGCCAEAVSLARVGEPATLKQRLATHCYSQWGLYVIIAFGLISISGCVAAGIALSAVQPHVVDTATGALISPTSASVNVSTRGDTVNDVTGRPSVNLLTKMFSTIRDAGMQEISLELKNATPSAPVSSNSLELASAIVENDSPAIYVFNSVETSTTIPKKHIDLEKYFPVPRPTPNYNPQRFTHRPFPFDQSRFFDNKMVISDPKYHDLNITFDDPFQPYLPARGRGLYKRSASYINTQGKRFPVIKWAKFTTTPQDATTTEPAIVVEETTVQSIELKALIPGKSVDGNTCPTGFEWSEPHQTCVDVDECLQIGIRACGINSECTNTPGSFSCRCSPGFRVDPKSLVCLDIDECKESNGECSPLALCENLPGGFVCKCMEGFYGNGIVCEIDESGVPDRYESKPMLPCQTIFPPRLHQTISNPYFPEPFPVLSRYKFCVQKLHATCKTGITIFHFVPSTTNHQDYDYLRLAGKIFTGTDLNGQTLWLLDSRDTALEIEYSTDSDLKGNRFTLELAQEVCGPVLAVPECSELLRVQGRTITSSPPHYMDNVACTAALYPPPDACGMELTFHEFSLEGPRETCPFDYLEINDDKLCGNMKNELREVIFPKNTPKVPIIFTSDATFVSRGFNISFTWIVDCFQ